MSLLDNQPHSATVIASTALDALVLSSGAFNECILNNAPLAVSVMRGLVNRLRKANQKIASLALVSVYGRVARHLIEIAKESDDGSLVITKKLSSVALARELGASREMVSKAIKDFEKQNFIEKLDNGHLLIHERRVNVRV
jgi:CRP-like cAMP-binding protein